MQIAPIEGAQGREPNPQLPTDAIGPHRRLETPLAAAPWPRLRGALSFLTTVFTDDTTPCPKALGRMLLHPIGKLWRAYQAGLHRHVSEVRRGNGLLMAICRRGETAEHGDDLNHDSPPSLR